MNDGPVYGRYTITAKDGMPLDPGRRLLVLSPDSDAHAAAALVFYARRCRETHPELSQSILETYELLDIAPDPVASLDDVLAEIEAMGWIWEFRPGVTAYAYVPHRMGDEQEVGLLRQPDVLTASIALRDAIRSRAGTTEGVGE